jgi:hypothetical protein
MINWGHFAQKLHAHAWFSACVCKNFACACSGNVWAFWRQLAGVPSLPALEKHAGTRPNRAAHFTGTTNLAVHIWPTLLPARNSFGGTWRGSSARRTMRALPRGSGESRRGRVGQIKSRLQRGAAGAPNCAGGVGGRRIVAAAHGKSQGRPASARIHKVPNHRQLSGHRSR